MSLDACAERVARGDPDRFRAAMSAAPAARAVLLPLYAFNLEVARAPWVTKEPMLAEMRLQWWRDVIEAAGQGAPPPAHEIAGPLAALVAAGRLDAATLDAVVEARRRDAEPRPMEPGEMRAYLEGTAGNLLWAAARALGGTDRAAVVKAGFAQGAAAWLSALPALADQRRAFEGKDPDPVRALAEEALAALAEARAARSGPPAALRAATFAGPLLRLAAADPRAALDGRLALPEGQKRWRLLWATLRGAW